jgi:hypothetical protein
LKKTKKIIGIKSEENAMKNVRIFIEKLGPGTIFSLICLMGIIPILLDWIGISCFPFIADRNTQKTLAVSFMFFVFGIAGLVLLIRREEGLLGIVISVFAVLWSVVNFYLALPPVNIFIHK